MPSRYSHEHAHAEANLIQKKMLAGQAADCDEAQKQVEDDHKRKEKLLELFAQIEVAHKDCGLSAEEIASSFLVYLKHHTNLKRDALNKLLRDVVCTDLRKDGDKVHFVIEAPIRKHQILRRRVELSLLDIKHNGRLAKSCHWIDYPIQP